KGESKPKAQWCEEEVDAFLVYLQSQVSKITGMTFKDETFNEAVKKLMGLQKQGPDKDMVQCKRKWQVGEAVELQWNQFITANNSNKILPNRSGTQGASAYNPASLAVGAPVALPINAEAGESFSSIQASEAPNAEASGSRLTAVPHTGWDQIKSALPSITPGVAGSAMNIPPPSSSIAL
ncbi:hypothetical protein EV424DRAFT_1356770, partial [Suillus variegatus]